MILTNLKLYIFINMRKRLYEMYLNFENTFRNCNDIKLLVLSDKTYSEKKSSTISV